MRVWVDGLLIKRTQVHFTVKDKPITDFCTFRFQIFNTLSLPLWAHISDSKETHIYTIKNKDLNLKKGVQNERVSVLFAEIPHLWLP